jgi:hypothetical protein
MSRSLERIDASLPTSSVTRVKSSHFLVVQRHLDGSNPECQASVTQDWPLRTMWKKAGAGRIRLPQAERENRSERVDEQRALRRSSTPPPVPLLRADIAYVIGAPGGRSNRALSAMLLLVNVEHQVLGCWAERSPRHDAGLVHAWLGPVTYAAGEYAIEACKLGSRERHGIVVERYRL